LEVFEMNVSPNARNLSGLQDAASPADTARDQQASSGTAPLTPRHKTVGEEPEMALEPDLPSDGRDAVGEAMIRDLPQRPELSEPPSQPHPSNQAT
jgi:hypothetical protein